MLVPNPEHKLQIGMTTQNTIITAQKQHVLVVPTLAIQKRNGQNSVQILDGDKVVEKFVQIGLHDDINTEILSGLNEGDNVILSQSSANEAASVKVRTSRMM